MSEIKLAPVGTIVEIGKHTWKISDEEIKAGDTIWNEAAKAIDYCVAKFSDDDIVVKFGKQAGSSKGMKAIFSKQRFQKAIKI